MQIAVAVAAAHFLQPHECGGIAQQRVDHGVDAAAQLAQIERTALAQLGHHVVEAGAEAGVGLLGGGQLGVDVAAELPLRLAQAGKLVLLAGLLQEAIAELEIARLGRQAARRIDVHVGALPLHHGHILDAAEQQAFERKRGFQPWSVKAADKHARAQALHADAHIDNSGLHVPPGSPREPPRCHQPGTGKRAARARA